MRNQPRNRKSKPTQTHEKSTKEQRNQPKEHTEKSKPKTQTTIQNYRNQIAQISPTNPRFMRRKGIEH